MLHHPKYPSTLTWLMKWMKWNFLSPPSIFFFFKCINIFLKEFTWVVIFWCIAGISQFPKRHSSEWGVGEGEMYQKETTFNVKFMFLQRFLNRLLLLKNAYASCFISFLSLNEDFVHIVCIVAFSCLCIRKILKT